MHIVNVIKLDHYDKAFELPQYETEQAAGADVRACFADRKGCEIAPNERVLIPTGMAFEIPKGFEVQVRPRSGLSLKTSLMVVNSPGTIDSDYRGEVKIILGNLGNEAVFIEHGMRVAQLVFAPVTQAKYQEALELSSTERGAGGFGSTGVK
jgi:dUTP pyrophosphatase